MSKSFPKTTSQCKKTVIIIIRTYFTPKILPDHEYSLRLLSCFEEPSV